MRAAHVAAGYPESVIASLRGTVVELGASSAVLDVGGVGYEVAITARHRRDLHLGDDVRLRTALVVRDDGVVLYGFEDHEHRVLFDALTQVSGVGPKLAMAVLGEITPAQAASAVASEQDAVFRKVPGIGPKMAKLMIVSLAGKLDALVGQALDERTPSTSSSATGELVSALEGLGWRRDQAQGAVAAVAGEEKSASEMLRDALRYLSGDVG